MMKMLEFLLGGMPPERRLPELVAWSFPGLVFLAAFPKELVGMNSYQWVTTSVVLSVGSRMFAGFPVFGLKLKENRATALRALTSVMIGMAGLGCCVMSRENFGWNWKTYVGGVLAMSVISFWSTFKAVEDKRKRRRK